MTDFEKLFNDHRAFIFKYLMKMAQNVSVADELTQETFFRAYMNYASLKSKEKAPAWLCQIAKNTYYAWYNEQKKKDALDHFEDLSDRESCDACRKLFEDMRASSDMISVSADMRVPSDVVLASEDMRVPSDIIPVSEAPVRLSKINDWKASVLQSVLLFLSFALITVGVALEAKTPAGPTNGFWALNLVIPATGFMLSLANWYFVRLYKSRKSFSDRSLLATLGITLCAYIWAWVHYHLFFGGIGIVLTVVFCILSKALSNQYAKMLGKE